MPVTLLTDLAETKLATAAGSGSQVAITHIALGDANGVTYDPAADATTLQNERARRAIDSTAFQGGNTWIVKAEFPTDTPSFAVREIGFFDQDGDLIAIWAGADVDPRQTGVIVYLVEHALSFSRVAEGLIIVDAPLDNEIYPGQMVLAKAGMTFEGWLECDGSEYDETVYPALAAAGYTTPVPVAVIDLGGAHGQLIFPVVVKINGVDRTFYYWDLDKTGSATTGDSLTHPELAAIFNGGADISNAPISRETILNGVTVRLPTLGSALGDTYFPGTAVSDPSQNNTTYDDYVALWDAFNGATTGTTQSGYVPGWRTSYYWTATDAGAGQHIAFGFGFGSQVTHPDANANAVALEVINGPSSSIGLLPDSTSLGAPTGYSYYIRHGGF